MAHANVTANDSLSEDGMTASIPFAAPPRRTLIVGNRGRMGAMLERKGRMAGLDIRGIDRPLGETDLSVAARDVELALICVPAKNFGDVLKKVTPSLAQDTILSDITSVKEKPMRQMEEIWPGKVVGTHPLFGPKNNKDDDLPVVLVRGKNADLGDLAKVGAFFTAIGCRVFEASAEKHDQAMARIQNMNFITNLAYFAVLAGQEELLPFLTPSFSRRKDAAAKMLNEDAEMFSGLFEANAHSHEAVRQYRKMLNVAASGDIELLCKKAQWWWRDSGKPPKNNFQKTVDSSAKHV